MAPVPGSLCQDAHKTARSWAISADPIESYLIGGESDFKYRFDRQFEQIPSVLGDSLFTKGFFSEPDPGFVRCNRRFPTCAVTRRRFSVGESPTRQLLLQPVAIGAVMEVTKWLKPLM